MKEVRNRRPVHPVFETVKVGAGRVLKNCFVLESAVGEDGKRLWVGNVLQLFRKSREGVSDGQSIVHANEWSPVIG